jgi:hypothetical protein
MPTHILFPMATRALADTSETLPLAGRVRASATLDVFDVSAGGSLTVALEASATGAEDAWRTVYAFDPQDAPTTVVADVAALALTARDRYFRARVTDLTGTATFALALVARWFDPVAVPADAALLTQECRKWSDGLDRIAQDAEATVWAALHAPVPGAAPTLAVDLTLPSVGEVIRGEIIGQTEHLFRRYRLTIANDPQSAVTLRMMGSLAPDFGRRLEPFRSRESAVWLGR